MKQLFFLSTILMSLLFTACGDAAEGSSDKGKEKAETAMTCKDLMDKKDELKDKEITIKAISWGASNTTTGAVHLSLGDEKLEGMKQAKVTVVFPETQGEEAKAVAKDSEVTIKATVGAYEYGAVKLNNPSIVK